MMRGKLQQTKDFITFPLRAITLFKKDKFGLSSLSTERYDYVAREVIGFCLDIGCGEGNAFVKNFLNGNGKGIDVFQYDGLSKENIVKNMSVFPFEGSAFESVTFIANLNHIPKNLRDIELAEAYRCLKTGGNIIVTMGNPLAEILVHKLVFLYARLLGKKLVEDTIKPRETEEDYFVAESEIMQRLSKAGFKNITKKRFWTQFGLNKLFVGWKK